jgi:DNA-binding NtrC family response regulator
VLLDLLKHDPETARSRSTSSRAPTKSRHATQMGAFGVTEKPADHDELAEVFRIHAEARARRSRKRRRRGSRARPEGAQPCPSSPAARILIVDDDIRNIYSLTSVLESYDVEVLHAERGATASSSSSRRPDRRRPDRHHDARHGRL